MTKEKLEESRKLLLRIGIIEEAIHGIDARNNSLFFNFLSDEESDELRAFAKEKYIKYYDELQSKFKAL